MRETESEFLLRHGWKLIQGTKIGYGNTRYWDHPEHKREDGLLWTQGVAYLLQRKINKEKGKRANE